MGKHTEWFCDGCDKNLGTGERRPRSALEIKVSLECVSNVSGVVDHEYESILCLDCYRKMECAIDTRMWMKQPSNTLPAVVEKKK
jgi:hypothetical protein